MECSRVPSDPRVRWIDRRDATLLRGEATPMAPDPNWWNAWSVTARGTCSRGGASLTDDQRAALEAEIAAIDFEQLDRLIEELVHGEAAAAGRARAGPADRGGPAAPDRRRARGAAPGRRGRGRRPGRRRGRRRSWSPAGRARGWASRARRGPSRSARSPRPACSRSMPRRSSPWAAGTAGRCRCTS